MAEPKLGFEVELSIERSKVIPKGIPMRFHNWESSYVKEYGTVPLELEDWRSILLTALTVYYTPYSSDFDLYNYRGAWTKKGESLHTHFSGYAGLIDHNVYYLGCISEKYWERIHNLTVNMIPIFSRMGIFRDTIKERAEITDVLLVNSKTTYITLNTRIGKDTTLELRINESVVGGWIWGLALKYVDKEKEIEGLDEVELLETDEGFLVKTDWVQISEFLKYLFSEVQFGKEDKIIKYILNLTVKYLKEYKFDWERRLLEVIIKANDYKLKRRLNAFYKRKNQAINGNINSTWHISLRD